MEDLFDSSLLRSANQTPTITICTDASYDPDMKVGAWACYIRSGDMIIKESKLITTEIDNSTEAERVGVAAALWIVEQKIDITKYKIILYCDNEAAMKPVRPSNKTGRKKQRAKQQLAFFEKNIHKHLQRALSYDVRHVKGHMERSARHRMKKRHYMNDWCDKAARAVLTDHRVAVENSIKENGI